jgi:hypothetical protein
MVEIARIITACLYVYISKNYFIAWKQNQQLTAAAYPQFF